MQKLLDGFLSSDIGKLSQVALSAAFPELIIAKKVGMPILRAFIDQVSTNHIACVLNFKKKKRLKEQTISSSNWLDESVSNMQITLDFFITLCGSSSKSFFRFLFVVQEKSGKRQNWCI